MDSNKLICLAVITFLTSENNRSLAADDVRIAKYFLTNCDRIKKCDDWDTHHLKGQVFTSISLIII